MTQHAESALGNVVGTLVLIGGVVWAVNSCSEWNEDLRKKAAAREAELSMVSVREFKWRKDGFGTVLVATFKVENALSYDIKDVRLECRVRGASGTVVSQPSVTIYEAFPAQKWKLVRDFSVGFISSQASTANCDVVGFKRV